MHVWNSDRSRLLWCVPVAPGTTALTLPALPVGLDPDISLRSRWAASRAFGVRP